MPVEGGLPQRRTGRRCGGGRLDSGWPRSGSHAALLSCPTRSCVAIDISGQREPVPLAQSAEGAYADDGRRFSSLATIVNPARPNATRAERRRTLAIRNRIGGGFTDRRLEGHVAQSHVLEWAVYFLSDRDGVMNIFSMDRDGHDLQQLHPSQRL